MKLNGLNKEVKMDFKEFIKEKGVSGYRISQETGIPKQTVLDIINNRIALEKTSLGNAYKIAKCLGIKTDDLIEKFNKKDEKI